MSSAELTSDLAAGLKDTGRGAAWIARLLGVQEVGGSNPLAPTENLNHAGA